MDEQIEMTTTGVTSFMNSIKTTLKDVLIKVIKKSVKISKSVAPLITHLASSIISLLGSIATLVTCNVSGFLKAIHITSIISSFTSMVMGITEIAAKFSVTWCPEAAVSTAHSMANQLIDNSSILHRSYSEPIIVRANSMNPITWVKAGVATVVAVLFSGLGISKLVPWKDIVTSSNVIEGIRKTSSTVNGIADFIVGEVVGFESSPDYPACKALENLAEEGAILQRFSPAHYIHHSEDFYRLKQYLPKLIKASSAPLSDKASKRFVTIKNILVQIYKNLEEKERSIDAILALKPRQATVGLLLSGTAGHGKSEFGKHISKKVAEIMGYPKKIYRLNKRQDGFYDPYGGDALGEYNEWMAMRSEDPILCDLNTIVSSDPMNFEAASLEGKIQPCQLKLAFFTANVENPEISRVLNEGATMAVWDRLYHIKINDPKCEGRHADNPHRKSDFSHLELTHIVHKSLSSFVEKKTTIATLTSRLVGRCCEAEMRYIKQLLEERMTLSEELVGSLDRRLQELQVLRRHNNPYEPKGGYEPGFDAYTDLFANSNSHSREFYTIRFQGATGSGKTRAAETLALQLSNLFGYEVQYTREQSEFIPDSAKPIIYILDDWVEAADFNDYVATANRTHPRSIIIVVSNTVFKKKREYKLRYLAENLYNYYTGNKNLKPWDATEFKKHPGFLRRCGLQGYVRMNPDQNATDELLQFNESLNRTYTLDSHMVIRDAYDVITTYDDLASIHFELYRSFLMRPTAFTIVEGPPPIEDPTNIGARIEAKGTREIMECLKSTKQKFAAYNHTHPDVTMYLAPAITGANSASQTTMFDWAMAEPVSDDPKVFRSAFSRFCGKFNRAFPGKSLTVKLKRENIMLYYVNGTAYIFNPDQSANDPCFSHTADSVHYKRNSDETIVITIDEYLSAQVRKEYIGSMTRLSYSEVVRLNKFINTIVETEQGSAFQTYYKLKMYKLKTPVSPLMLKIEAELRNHPFFWAGIGLLAVGVASASLYYLIKKIFGKDKPPEEKVQYVNVNSASPAESKGKSHSQAAIRKIALKSNSDTPKEAKGHKASSKVLSKIAKIHANSTVEFPEAEIRQELTKFYSGADMGKIEQALASFTSSLEDGEEPHIALCKALTTTETSDIRESPTLSTVHANMLRASDMIPQRDSKIHEKQKSLTRYAVRVIANSTDTCYGFSLKSNYILTVSHLFREVGEPCQIINDSKYFKAKVVLLDRARDLAVVYVVDKTFPALADTRRFFHSMEDLKQAKYGFFLRCGPDAQIIGGPVTYFDTTSRDLSDKTNENFQLSKQLVEFTAAGLQKVRDFVQIGDCGFPLVTSNQLGEFKIMGIHCAYNTHEAVFFSSFSCEDHSNYLIRSKEYVASKIEEPTPIANLRPDRVLSNKRTSVKANAGVDMGVDNVIVDGEVEFLLPAVYTHAIAGMEEDTRFTTHSDKLDILGFSRDLALRSRPKLSHNYVEVEGMKTDLLTLPAAFNEDFVVDTSKLACDDAGRSDSLFTQCLKYDQRKQCSFNLETLNEAIELVRQDCVNRYEGCKFLRLYNVINGIPGKLLTPVDTSTSAGPLLKMTHGITIKAPLFKLSESQTGRRTMVFNDTDAAVMVRKHYETFVNSLHDGGPPPLIVSKDCAKVELIDADKARAGKVRLFNEVDISINLMLKHFFGDFAEKVMAKHEESPIRMGQDPYRCANHIYRQFQQIEGNIISTDFSAFDKQLPAVLIAAFCDIVASCYIGESHPDKDIYNIFANLAKSLTHVLHTCRGTIYLVDRGNESGTFVTTIMNSVSVQILTYYTVIRKWYIIFRFTPTLSEVLSQTRLAILGDDRTFKCTSALEITEQDFIDDSVEFCLVCTSAKTQGYIDFCSRSFVWDEFNQVVFPALKKSSVVSQLRWYRNLTESQIKTNLDNVLFEAALHEDKILFEECLHDVRLLCKHWNLPSGSISFYDRDSIRKRFVFYQRDAEELDRLSHQVQRELQFSTSFDVVEKYHKAFSERIAKSATVSTADNPDNLNQLRKRAVKVFGRSNELMTDPKQNPISALLERLREVDPNLVPEEECQDVPDGFIFDLKLLGYSASAMGHSKKIAKRAAYSEMYDKVSSELRELRANTRKKEPLDDAKTASCGKDYMYRSIKIHLRIAEELATRFGEDVAVLSAIPIQGDIIVEESLRYMRDSQGVLCALSETAQSLPYKQMSDLYLRQRGTFESGERVYIRPCETHSNASRPTASGTVPPADAANNPGIASIPSMQNPVPLSVAPAMHENPGSTLGAYEILADVETYNTSGPPNMLSAGAIAFDLKDLVYNQFMDCDTMYTFTDDTKDGSIIFQIPYSPASDFINPYIKQYVSLHERYAGDLMFRLTLVGNQTFSGLVGISWQPSKIAGDTIKVSEAQKYSYAATTVNEMWNKGYTLKDARQDLFWRSVKAENPKEEALRPHLVFFVLMNAQSPLREGISVRLRVASKLCPNFQVANPTLPATPPTGPDSRAFGIRDNQPGRLIGSPIIPTLVRPIALQNVKKFYLCMDGNTWKREPTNAIATDYQMTNWETENGKWPVTQIVTHGDEMIWQPRSYMRNGLDIIFYDLSHATSMLTEMNIKTVGEGEVIGINKTALAFPVALNKLLFTGKVTYPATFFKEIMDSQEYKDAGGLTTPISYTEMLVPEPPKTIKIGLLDVEVASFRHFYITTSSGSVSFGSITIKQGDIPIDPDDILFNYNEFTSTLTQVNNVGNYDDVEAMPTGWRSIVISADVPFVYNEAARQSSMFNHPTLLSLIDYMGFTISPSQCLQFSLGDMESGRDMAYIRYFPDRRAFAINAGYSTLFYGTSARPVERMYITSIGIIERTNDFPETPVDQSFMDNQTHPARIKASMGFH